jgi:hypothetical protein
VVIEVRPTGPGSGDVEAVQILSAPGAHIVVELAPTLDGSGALSLAHPKHPTDRGTLNLEKATRQRGRIDVRIVFESESSCTTEFTIMRGSDGLLAVTAKHSEILDTSNSEKFDRDPHGRIKLSQSDLDHPGPIVLECDLPGPEAAVGQKILLEGP